MNQSIIRNETTVYFGRLRQAEVLVPDVKGELWEEAVAANELPEEWMKTLRQSVGALLFVRAMSPLNKPALDWVTARRLLELDGAAKDPEPDGLEIPTDVQLCEFLRLLEFALGKDATRGRPRVAVLVAAWDRLDRGRARLGPRAYLRDEFPLFSGRLANVPTLDVEVFGLSVVGGDFVEEDFTRRFLEAGIDVSGYVVTEPGEPPQHDDVTAPVRWILEGKEVR